jgi:hypothetical protein
MAFQSSLTARELADEFFIENRNRLLEIAAFLDRLDRPTRRARRELPAQALTEALNTLAGRADYVRRIRCS